MALGVVAVASLAPQPGRATGQGARPGNQSARKPNTVIILGDDLGNCDTGLYGCKDIPTPHEVLCWRNALFHHPADRWPEAVDVAAVARYARAFVKVAITLAQ